MAGGFQVIPIRNFCSPSQTHLQGRGETKPASCTADEQLMHDGDADGVPLCSHVLGHCQLLQKLSFLTNLCLAKRLVHALSPIVELGAHTSHP